MAGIQVVLNIINYELYKETNRSNSFSLDCRQLLAELREAITKNFEEYKQEKPDFEIWLDERSKYIYKTYNLIL